MNGFLWTSGHLGWGIFAVAVISALWLLSTDLYWRLKSTRLVPSLGKMMAGWAIGVVVIVLGFFLANR
jgi:hypothetical protein